MNNYIIYNQNNHSEPSNIIIVNPDPVRNIESDKMIIVYSILTWVALIGISTAALIIIKYHNH